MGASTNYMIKFGADASSVTKAINGLNLDMKTLNKVARDSKAAFKLTGDTSQLQTAITATEKKFELAKKKAQDLETALNGLRDENGELPDTVAAKKLASQATAAKSDVNKLGAELEDLGKQKAGAEISSDMDKASKSIKNAEGSTGKLHSSLKTSGVALGSFLGSLGGNLVSAGIGMVGSVFSGMGSDIMQASDSLDKFKSTMSFAGKSSKDISKLTTASKKYADDTVYDLNTILNTTAQLGANGVKNYGQLVQAAGNLNAVVGGNNDTFGSLSMVLTQTAGAGKLTTDNWNQVADAIPGASMKLQDAMKKNGAYTGNFRDAMEKGQISSEEFNKAIMDLGMTDVAKKAAASTKTIEGAVGNLQASVQTVGMNMFNAIKKPLTDAISFVANAIPAIAKQISGLFSGINAGGLSTVITSIQTAFSKLDFSGLKDLLSAIIPGLIAGFQSFVSSATPGITMVVGAFKNLWNALQPVFSVIGSMLVPAFKILGSYLGGLFNGILSAVSTAFNGVAVVVKILTPVIKFIGKVFTALTPIFSKVANWLGNLQGSFGATSRIFSGVGRVLGAVGRGISSTFAGVWNKLSSAFSSMKSGFSAVGRLFSSVAKGIGGIPGRIAGWFSGIGGRIAAKFGNVKSVIGGKFSGIVKYISGKFTGVTKIGTNVVKGIARGITGGFSFLKGVIKGFVGSTVSFIKKLFKIHSPSRLMRDEVGVYITRGVAVGMRKGFKSVNQASAQLSKNVTNTMTGLRNKFNSGKLSATQYLKALKQMKKVARSKSGYNSNIANRIDSQIIAQNNRMRATTNASKKQLATIKNNLKTTQNGLQSSVKSAISTYNKTVKDALSSARDTVFSAYDMFDRVSNQTLSSEGLTNSLISQVDALSRYQSAMAKLKKNGASTGLLNTLRSMGVGNVNEVSALANMTKRELATYQSYYNKKVSLSNAIAKSDPQYLSAVKSAKTTFDKSLQSSLNTFDTKVRGYGVQAKNNGLYIGRKLQSGLVSALSISKSNPLAKALKSLSNSIKNTMKKNLGIHSPSRVMRDEVGTYITQGIGVGMITSKAMGTINRSARTVTNGVVNAFGSMAGGAGLNGGIVRAGSMATGTSSVSTANNSLVFNISGGDPNQTANAVRKVLRQEKLI